MSPWGSGGYVRRRACTWKLRGDRRARSPAAHTLQSTHPSIDATDARPRIERAAFRLLDASPLCVISTAAPRTIAHIHTAYFAWNKDFEIFWLSDPAAKHSRNIRARPSTAISVFDSHQVWGQPDRGIQLFGSTRQLPATQIAPAESLYATRFPGYATPDLRAYRFYQFRSERLKLFDEAVFGAGVFVTATIHSGQPLIWERTDISSGAKAN